MTTYKKKMSKTTNYLRNYIRKVTSQNGEEGVIEFLLNKIFKLKIPKPICLKISPDIGYKDDLDMQTLFSNSGLSPITCLERSNILGSTNTPTVEFALAGTKFFTCVNTLES